MKSFNVSAALATSSIALSTSLFCATSQAALVGIGNGLIYDDVSNVTWISDGYAFNNDIASTTANATSNPYTGPLLGTVVTPSLGVPRTITATDLDFTAGLSRWVGSWWAATAWADSFSYQYGTQTISDWRLPTSSEAQNLIDAIEPGNYGAVAPFTWVPPFFWTSDLTGETSANIARPLFGTIDSFSLMNGSVPRFSNVWAVVPGNIAAVPAPAAVWLFASALAGMGVFGRHRDKTTA